MSNIPYFPDMTPYKAGGILMKAAKAHAKGTHDKSGSPHDGVRVSKGVTGGGRGKGVKGGGRGGKK